MSIVSTANPVRTSGSASAIAVASVWLPRSIRKNGPSVSAKPWASPTLASDTVARSNAQVPWSLVFTRRRASSWPGTPSRNAPRLVAAT